MKVNSEIDLRKQVVNEVREVKKALKQLSKNQLIALVLQQTNIALEQQNLNKQLVEELDKVKETKNEESK